MGIEGKKEVTPIEKEKLLQEYREAKKFFQKPFGELFFNFLKEGHYPSSDPEEEETGIAEAFFRWMSGESYHFEYLRKNLSDAEIEKIDKEFEK